MPHPTGPTNPELLKLIEEFRKKKMPFYSQIARHLAKPARKKNPVTLFKINKVSMENDKVFVPSRVLATGKLDKKLEIYALRYSADAREKIKKSGSKALPLKDVLKSDVKGRIVI